MYQQTDTTEASRSHFYESDEIDRCAELRGDEAWVNEQLGAAETLFVPVWRRRSLVERIDPDDPDALEGVAAPRLEGGASPEHGMEPRLRAAFVEGGDLAPLLDGHRRAILLGESGSRTYFALDVSDLDEPEEHEALAGSGKFVGLRRVGPLLDRFDGGLLAYARGMVWWHEQHSFCGACGNRTAMEQAGFLRRCTNGECGRVHFPRTDPAIIVLVTREDRALLGRQAKWESLWYSVLAGFVEPGESLEQAVRREVKEEAGLPVGEVRYQSSQPWPFPSSLMIGFTAEALDDAIAIGDDELEDARWFTRDELGDALASGEIQIPPRVSISRQLIEGWRESGT